MIENPVLAEKMGKAGRENIKFLNKPQKRIDDIYQLMEKIMLLRKE